MWKLISLELIENKLTLVRLVLELYAPVYFRPTWCLYHALIDLWDTRWRS